MAVSYETMQKNKKLDDFVEENKETEDEEEQD